MVFFTSSLDPYIPRRRKIVSSLSLKIPEFAKILEVVPKTRLYISHEIFIARVTWHAQIFGLRYVMLMVHAKLVML